MIYKYKVSLFIYKYLSNLLPPVYNINTFSEVVSNKIKTKGSSNRNIFCPYAATNTRLFTIKFSGQRIWNSIPLTIKTINNITI